jgi:hypothetical protein
MLRFTLGDTSVVLILTLSELATQSAPDYHFVFTHILTRDTVTFTKTNAEDESLFQSRYNKFTINPSVVFANKQPGEWHYKVYEDDASGVLLEQGKMMLAGAEEFAFEKYDSQTSFKTYNG